MFTDENNVSKSNLPLSEVFLLLKDNKRGQATLPPCQAPVRQADENNTSLAIFPANVLKNQFTRDCQGGQARMALV
jgi:hypothetical protein